MKTNILSGNKLNTAFVIMFISLLLLSSSSIKAQKPVNFSGKWEFDKARSDKDETGDASFDGTIIMEIRLGSDTISFLNTYYIPGKKAFVSRPDPFLLNGKVTDDNSGSDPAKKFLKWSQDKKILTTNLTMTATIDGAAQDFIVTLTYKLSDDGKTLFVEETHKSKLNGEKTIKKVYKKKA